MPTYIEYQLDENSSILIEAPSDGTEGMVKASREVGELPKLKAKTEKCPAGRFVK